MELSNSKPEKAEKLTVKTFLIFFKKNFLASFWDDC